MTDGRWGRMERQALAAMLALALLSTCQPSGERARRSAATASPDSTARDDEAVRAVVREFGGRLQRVALLAPRADLVAAIRREYGAFVTPALLERWTHDPASAPGRLTSSPWPDHIEIEQILREPGGRYGVIGSVVERTSADLPGGAQNRVPVRLTLVRNVGRWSIAGYEESRPAVPDAAREAPGDEAADAMDVIRAYYRAIREHRYADAWRLWDAGGAASGKSLDEFQSGFTETAGVEVTLGTPGPLGAAAGSRYLEIPVRVVATLRNGTRQEFAGAYTLRRSVVDGATPEQQSWRIYSAKLRQVR